MQELSIAEVANSSGQEIFVRDTELNVLKSHASDWKPHIDTCAVTQQVV